MDSPPDFALFRHEDGSWYRLWITESEPKTERGHRFHVHASFDKTGTVAPIAGTVWYRQPYGMSNWDFDTFDAAARDFAKRAEERLAHGYVLREGAIPEVTPQTRERAA